jgi:Ca2+-binding EF-hand superfamily protein
MDTFLKLDLDGDGFVSRSDLFTSLHNMYGINLTESQLDAIFTRFAYFDHSSTSCGMRYADFVNYIHDTALDFKSSSEEYGSTLDLIVAKNNNEYHTTTASISNTADEIRHPLNTTASTTRTTLQLILQQTSTTTSSNDAEHHNSVLSSSSSFPEDCNTKSDEQLILALSRTCSSTNAEGGLAKAFDQFNSSNTGKLGPTEICSALTKTGIPISKQRAASLITNFDRDDAGNGEFLNKADFVSMISTTMIENIRAASSLVQATSIAKNNYPHGNLSLQPTTQHHYRSPTHERILEAATTDEDHAVSSRDTNTNVGGTTDIESIILKLRSAMKEHCVDATRLFHKLDKANNRTITPDQLMEVFEELGVHATPVQINHMVSKFDSEGSGKLKFYQFLNLVSSG